ncbi:methyltransferase domain-containing protein [Sphingomonas profundi]|uniref:methyltransferase domain-containing protein n=1 Tax=Alterirhizorhabdus profundi TaxID=2681549 RepID=UPI0012E8952E|nr:class I SAM-dependent methyltransferase [Sphingomonas profundi]
MLGSMACRYEHFETEWYAHWATLTGHPAGVSDDLPLSYRKLWEWSAIMQALAERGMLQAGRAGIGFAVGMEALPSIFASYGVDVLASDLPEEMSDGFWDQSSQHSVSVDALFHPRYLDEATFRRLVRFRPTDMNDLSGLPDASWDFAWSSCAIEHLGGLDQGLDFVRNAMRLLKPGGVAVHTTEYNCSSNDDTVTDGGAVIYRKQDLERLDYSLRPMRCGLEPLNFDLGTHRYDLDYDEPPYFSTGSRHIKLAMQGYIATSYLIIVQKAG